MSIDQEIDRLYQLPLSEFIAARNALAKRAGGDAARVKALEKPNAAAWAVNQLYWRDRPIYDAVIKAARRARTAHAHSLTGKKADVPLAEAAQAAAVRHALDRAEAILRQAGDAVTGATLAAVRQTLNALATETASESTTSPGRLTRPIEAAVGFGALSHLLAGAAIHPASTAEIVRFPRGKSRETDGKAAEAERARAEAARLRKELADQKGSLESSIAGVRRQLAELEDERADLAARTNRIEHAISKIQSEIERKSAALKAVDEQLKGR